jgi:hypothetical protein
MWDGENREGGSQFSLDVLDGSRSLLVPLCASSYESYL